jgi:hypothetical protein
VSACDARQTTFGRAGRRRVWREEAELAAALSTVAAMIAATSKNQDRRGE